MDITPGFYHRPDSETVPGFPGWSGGVRIVVDGTPLTRFATQTVADRSQQPVYSVAGDQYDTPEQFVGINLASTLGSLFDAFEPFALQDAERHQEYVGELFDEPPQMVIALSHLDGECIRIAALPYLLGQQSMVHAESQLGYSVPPEAFANALAECYEECLDYTRRAFIYTDDYRGGTDFSSYMAELRAEYQEDIEMLRNVSG